MATRMLQRRGTAAEWAAENPILADGEIGFERDTGVLKVGDGVTAWEALQMTWITSAFFDAKGDLIVGTGNNTYARLPVAAGGLLVPSPGAASGLAWSNEIVSSAADAVTLILKAIGGQSADVFQLRSALDAILTRLDAAGTLFVDKVQGQTADIQIINALLKPINANSYAARIQALAGQVGSLLAFINAAGATMAKFHVDGSFHFGNGDNPLANSQGWWSAAVGLKANDDAQTPFILRRHSATQNAELAQFQDENGANLSKMTTKGAIVQIPPTYWSGWHYGNYGALTYENGEYCVIDGICHFEGIVLYTSADTGNLSKGVALPITPAVEAGGYWRNYGIAYVRTSTSGAAQYQIVGSSSGAYLGPGGGGAGEVWTSWPSGTVLAVRGSYIASGY